MAGGDFEDVDSEAWLLLFSSRSSVEEAPPVVPVTQQTRSGLTFQPPAISTSVSLDFSVALCTVCYPRVKTV